MATIIRNKEKFVLRETPKKDTIVRIAHTCEYCGVRFLSAKQWAKYCCNAHKQAKYRERLSEW